MILGLFCATFYRRNIAERFRCVFSNRAIAALKLQRFEHAVQDASAALFFNPQYAKACELHASTTTHHHNLSPRYLWVRFFANLLSLGLR